MSNFFQKLCRILGSERDLANSFQHEKSTLIESTNSIVGETLSKQVADRSIGGKVIKS